MDWIKKFVINRFLYLVLLIVLCVGIFPFVLLFNVTVGIGRIVDKVSRKTKIGPKIERGWDVLGRPYDALVRLVG